jgi:hypothetical protein
MQVVAVDGSGSGSGRWKVEDVVSDTTGAAQHSRQYSTVQTVSVTYSKARSSALLTSGIEDGGRGRERGG